MLKENTNTLNKLEWSEDNNFRHVFNLHHLQQKKSPSQSYNDLNLLSCQVHSGKKKKKQEKKEEKRTKQSRNVIEMAIESIESYYNHIQICIQRYKKQEIDQLKKLNQRINYEWTPTKKFKMINKKQTVFCHHSFKHQKLNISPPSFPQINYDNLYLFTQNLISDIKQRVQLFPFLGAKFIKLIQKKEKNTPVKGEKSQLKWVKKDSNLLDVSKIEEVETDESYFDCKKAFRELFPDQQEVKNEEFF